MRHLIGTFLSIFMVTTGCSGKSALSPSEFAAEFGEAVKKSLPNVKVKQLDEMEFEFTTADGQPFKLYLGNAYDQYKQDPSQKAAIFEKYLKTQSELSETKILTTDATRIVPIVKNRNWLENLRQLAQQQDPQAKPSQVYDELNSELIVLYGEDSEGKVRYLSADDLETAKVDRNGLRALACDNLKRLHPGLKMLAAGTVFMLELDGTYESSMLLFDKLWTSGQLKVNGEIVVAVPTRDMLLVTGSNDAAGLAKVRETVNQAHAAGPYQISEKLFVYRQGKFEVF